MLEYLSTCSQSNAGIHLESFLSGESYALDGYILGNCGSEVSLTAEGETPI